MSVWSLVSLRSMRTKSRSNDGVRFVERSLIFIIVTICVLSLYFTMFGPPTETLTVISLFPQTPEDGRPPSKRNTRPSGSNNIGILGSFFGDRKHEIINENRPPNSTSLLRNVTSKVLGLTLPVDLALTADAYKDWFRPLPAEQISANFDHSHHPTFPGFLITNDAICKDKTVDILIYFQSAAANIARRQVLRETWANESNFKNIKVKTIFIVGLPKDVLDQMRIQHESLVHRDIVQGEFEDTRSNLCYKAILVSRWITQFCMHARYILKADDDIFVNIVSVVENLIQKLWKKRNSIMCDVKRNGTSQIIRNAKSVWYVQPEVFPGETTFPTFCSGYFVLFTPDIIPQVYEATFRIPTIRPDDVYMFGLALYMNEDIEYISITQNLTLSQSVALEQYKGPGDNTYMAANAYEPGALEAFWTNSIRKFTPWALKNTRIGEIEMKMKRLNIKFDS